jgi:hypothetical protein
MHSNPRKLRVAEAAEYLGRTKRFLDKLRLVGGGRDDCSRREYLRANW